METAQVGGVRIDSYDGNAESMKQATKDLLPALNAVEEKPAKVEEPAKPDAATVPAKEPTAEETAAAAAAAPPAKVEEPVKKADDKGFSPSEAVLRIKAADGRAQAEARRANDEKARADKLSLELEALKNPKAAEPVTDPKPNPSEIGTKFADYDAYIEALTAHTMRQAGATPEAVAKTVKAALEEFHAGQQKAATEKVLEDQRIAVITAYDDRLAKFKAATSDFDQVVKAAGDVDFGPIVAEHIVHSDLGPALLYHLSKSAEDRAQLLSLAPAPALVLLGKIETRLEGAPSRTGPPAAAPVTKAPDPIVPVGAAPVASTVPLERLPIKDYMAEMDERDRQRSAAR